MAIKKRTAEEHAIANLEAATIIVADISRYPSPLMQNWADRILSDAAERDVPKDAECGPLFKAVA